MVTENIPDHNQVQRRQMVSNAYPLSAQPSSANTHNVPMKNNWISNTIFMYHFVQASQAFNHKQNVI